MFQNLSLILVLILSLCLVLFSYIIPAFYIKYMNKMNKWQKYVIYNYSK